ncbi:UTRA domain-containing protein [Frigidibacter sp. MR17.14]|uniref:UTRA domain-containing protein n=1 Tax=Frigidibacter sp. MR17.14 TaxID=3126509 RepID=UPI003012C3C4
MTGETDPADRPAASWQAIRDEVLRRIRDRDWRPGDPIPNEADLAIEFGCARATVNRALRELAAAGVLERRRRAGTRVAPAPVGRAGMRIPVLHRDVVEAGQVYGHRLIAREVAVPPPEVAARMGLAAGVSALHALSLHLADDRPLAFEDRWIDPAVVPGILAVDFAAVSANEWLVENMPFSEGAMRIAAVPAGALAAGHLQVPEGTALLAVERTTWREGRAITHVAQMFAPGHWMQLDLVTG